MQQKMIDIYFIRSSADCCSVSPTLPNSRALKEHRVRQIKQIVPIHPNSLHFETPDSLKKTLSGDEFLLFDSRGPW